MLWTYAKDTKYGTEIKQKKSWQNQQNDLCAQRWLRSAWASAQSDQSSLSAWWNIGPLTTCWAHSEDCSNRADAQADLSLRWAHGHFVGFGLTMEQLCDDCHAGLPKNLSSILKFMRQPLFFIWAAARQNQQNDMCAQRLLRSAWASAQPDQSSLCAH